MDAKTSEWRPGPSVCRCCLAEGCYKDISTEYFWMGKREVYAEMLSDTFSVSIAYSSSGGPNSNSRLICEPCISRLRDAADFKRQVQECEKTFMQHLDPGGSSTAAELEIQALQPEKEVKLEQVKLEKRFSDDEFDNVDFGDDDDDDMDDQPLTKFATKVPKKETVDFLDLIDNSQITVKRKSTSKSKTPPSKKVKVSKKESSKPTASKAPIKITTEKKKKDGTALSNTRRNAAPAPLSTSWRNAALIIENSTVYPFRLPDARIMCLFCCEEYVNSKSFRDHMDTEHVNYKGETAFAHRPASGYIKADCTNLRCRICSEIHPTLTSITKHLINAHEKNFSCESDLGIQPFKFPNEKFLCGICDTNFPCIRLLSRHMTSHFRNYTCEECGKSFTTKNVFQTHLTFSHPKNGHLCRKCKQTFDSLEAKKEHIAASPKCWVYHCSLCSQRFISWKFKEQHMIDVHGRDKKTYSCPECGDTFISRRTYRTHFMTNHAGFCFTCPECGRKFCTKRELDLHSVVHTGIKIFECDVCAKCFPRKYNLRQHMWIHSEYKRFECVPCKKKFNQKICYILHMKNHHSADDEHGKLKRPKRKYKVI